LTVVESLLGLASKLGIERVEQIKGSFTLWWSPAVDEGREKHQQITQRIRLLFAGKRVLEVGFPWGGRVVPGSKVMDLYDPRPGVDYRMDACRMEGIPDGSFDLVVCFSVLEHIPKFWLAAAEIQRVLAPGGIVYVGVPSVWPYHPGGNFQGTDVSYGGDYWRMNHAAMVTLFDQCRKVAVWYVPASPAAGDDPRSGWGVAYLGEKR